MCFSSGASFAVASVLLPAGISSVRYCLDHDRRELVPLAVSPVLFALQQGLEGLVWLGLDTGSGGTLVREASLGYLFFAYAFWLAWIPWCALCLGRHELGSPRRWLHQAILILGMAVGIGLWLPLLLDPGLIRPAVVEGSIAYNTTLVAQDWISLEVGSTIYAAIITVPLLLSRSAGLRWFAALIVLAFLVTHAFYPFALTSVWCYFSAVFSVFLYWILREPAPVVAAAR